MNKVVLDCILSLYLTPQIFGCKIQYWFLLQYTYEYLWQLSILTKPAFFSKFYTFSSTSISIYTVINIGLTQNYKQKLYPTLYIYISLYLSSWWWLGMSQNMSRYCDIKQQDVCNVISVFIWILIKCPNTWKM